MSVETPKNVNVAAPNSGEGSSNETDELYFENRALLTGGIISLRNIRDRVNQELDPVYLFAAYEQAEQMARLVLADCGILQVDFNRPRLEQITKTNLGKFQVSEALAGRYNLPATYGVNNLYRLGAKFKSRIDQTKENTFQTQLALVKFISQDYLSKVNNLAEPELQNITSKSARFVSPLSGGLVTSIMWKLVVEAATDKKYSPIVLGASVDSKKNYSYIQGDASTISEDNISYVYILDDALHTGGTVTILTKTVAQEYSRAKIYSGEAESSLI